MSEQELQDANYAHWKSLLNRLATASTALSQALEQSSEWTRNLLDARARAMAEAPQSSRASDSSTAIVEFRLAGQRCAIPTRFVCEALPLPE
jgi:hypothetical protein